MTKGIWKISDPSITFATYTPDVAVEGTAQELVTLQFPASTSPVARIGQRVRLDDWASRVASAW